MERRPVHWREGMFLGPHHFQTADRHTRAALKESEDWFHPFCWGLRAIEFDTDAIANYTITVRTCQARFADGTRLSLPADGVIDSVPIADDQKKRLDQAGAVDVYLAVPTIEEGRANVEPERTESGPRYSIVTVTVQDEATGANEQDLEVLLIRNRVFLSGQDRSGYQVLRLGRIIRGAEEGARPRLDVRHVPPLLVLDAWKPLWERVQGLYHQIGGILDELAAQAIDRSITFESQVPGDAERLLFLTVLNRAYSTLQSFVFLEGLTPLFSYRELCRVLGELSIFGATRRPAEMPQYDHENLGSCFDEVIRAIEELLRLRGPRAFEKVYFEREQQWLQAALEPAWLSPTRRLFLGVETDLEHDDCVGLLLSTSTKKSLLDIKMGSAARVKEIFRQGLRGLNLVPISIPPSELPRGRGVVYFKIEQDKVFWKNVAETGLLAVMVNSNHSPFKDDRAVVVTTAGDFKGKELRFALFIIEQK